MLIILEGPARTGKTTLAAWLDELFAEAGINSKRYKEVRDDHPVDGMRKFQAPLAYDKNAVHIVDRSLLTEQVMSNVYGRRVDWTYDDMKALDRLFAEGQTLLVLLTADEKTLLKRHEETKRELENGFAPSAVLAQFEDAYEASTIDKVKLDTSEWEPEALAKLLVASCIFAGWKPKGGSDD